MVFWAIAVFLASAALIVTSSKWVVDNSLGLSKIIGVSTFAIGFIILSISTSLPELAVALFSSLGGTPQLSLGTIFGSNVTNFTLIIAAVVFFGGEIYLKSKVVRELLELLLITTIVTLFIFFQASITFVHGIVFLAFFALLVRRLYKKGRIPPVLINDSKRGKKNVAAMLLAGLATLVAASYFLVSSAVQISSTLGIAQTVFGAVAIALSTSLPELSVEIRAIKQKEYALAMGDLFGSAVANITLVLGSLIIISPVPLDPSPLLGAVFVVLAAMALIWLFFVRRGKIGKKEAALLFLLYAVFVIYELGFVML